MALRTRFSLVVAGLAAAGAAAVAYLKRDRISAMCRSLKERRDGGEPPETPLDDVDRTERDSFPASDPPSYGPGL
ncbi:MAG: hypothetical protein ACLGG9_03705 [Thermoleophilia bacterium]|jgi:hypothetical protein